MLGIFLDETGSFESQHSKLCANAGLLYSGSSYSEDIENLRRFLIKQSKKYNLSFPKGLHGSGIERKTKLKIQNELLSYITDSKGTLSVVAIFNGNLSYSVKTNVLDNQTASNRHLNMLMHLLHNILFFAFSQEKTSDNVILRIASRVQDLNKKDVRDTLRQNQYNKLGYSFREVSDSKLRYYVLSHGMVSVALNRLYAKDQTLPDYGFDIKVHSIYEEYDIGLIAADLIANWLYGWCRGENLADGVLSASQFLQDAGGKAYIWAYDEIDEAWRRLFNHARNNEIYQYYDALYNFNSQKSIFRDYYKQKWHVKEPEISLDAIKNSLEFCAQALKQEKVDYNKEWSILKQIEHRSVQNKNLEVKYFLHDLLLRCANHTGKVSEAFFYAEQAAALAKDLPHSEKNIKSAWETFNRAAVIYTNYFAFQTAIDYINNNAVSPLQTYSKVIEETFGKNIIEPALGKCFSSIGQNHAFLGNYKESLDYFEQALPHFTQREFDEKITMSYILHLACSYNERSLFEKYARLYFNKEKYDKCQKYSHLLEKVTNDNNPYKMLIYLKGLRSFYTDEINGLSPYILNDKFLNNFTQDKYNHPWELIYRHLYEIFYAGNENAANIYLNQSLKVGNGNNFTLGVLHLGTQMIHAVNSFAKDKSQLKIQYERILAEFKELCAINGGEKAYHQSDSASWFHSAVCPPKGTRSSLKKAHKFIEKFTFMYR